MKKILLIGLFFNIQSLLCMRPRSHSFVVPQRSKSEDLAKTRARSNSLSLEKKDKDFLLTRNRRRSLSSSRLRESAVVQKVRKVVINNQITDEDVQQIRFFLALYERAKKNRQQEKEELLLNIETEKIEHVVKKDDNGQKIEYDMLVIDKKDDRGKTLLYKAIEKANQEIKNNGQLSTECESQLCFLLAAGANQHEQCGTILKSPRDIASSKIKQLLNNWNRPWSLEKDKMVEQGIKYLDRSKIL